MALKIVGKTTPAPVQALPNVSEYEKHLDASPVTGTVHVEKQTTIKAQKATANKPAAATQKILTTIKDEYKVVHPGVMADPANLIRLGVEASHTVNLGNFESARIGVTINLPCTMADIEDTYKFGLDWVSSKIEEAISDAKN